MTEYIQIGTITATHGLKGEIVVHAQFPVSTNIEELSLFFVEKMKDSFIPYFITSLSLKSEVKFITKIEGIDSKEEAKVILKKNIFLKARDLKEVTKNEVPIHLKGFTLWDRKEKDLGSIIEIIEYPKQILAKIEHKNQEMLIPLNEETIREIHPEKEIIYVELPEGLLDIYQK